MSVYPVSAPIRASSIVAVTLGNQPTVAIPTPFVRLLGDWTAAAFLAQCLYWSQRSKGGWFYKTHDDWGLEICLSADQVRRCVKTSDGLIEVERRGIPAKNYYRVNRELLDERLRNLNPDLLVPSELEATEPEAELPSVQLPPIPTASGGETQQQVPRPTPQLSQEIYSKNSIKIQPKAGRDDVAITPTTDVLTRLLDTWNANRGDLPEASGLTLARRKALGVLLTDCGGNAEQTLSLLTDATKEVARDEFWQHKRFGLDTLLPKVFGRAEAWRSRQKISTSQVKLSFEIGERVTYRRERYAIETITDRYIDLWDEENGSARILINSDDIRGIKPLEVRA